MFVTIFPSHWKEGGAGDGNRTHNLLITNQLLCQLSYTGMTAQAREKNGDPEGARTLDL